MKPARGLHPLFRLLYVGAFTAAVLVQSLVVAAPTPDLTARIDALFSKWDRPDSPGAIVAVARAGETLHARAYGMADLEHGIALTPGTVSESGSVAKQFTAAAVVLLAQRGRLSLDDSIRRHLPELPAELAEGITVRMLLNHTSGLRDIHGLFDLLGRPSYSSFHDNAEVLRVMSRQRRLNFEPGTEYLYCNAAYILATVLVQRASGQEFGAFCQEHLFTPRGMTDTRWRQDFSAVIRGRATGYAPAAAGGFRIDTPYSNLVGNGGLLTTVGDLLRWNASLDHATGEWAEVVRLLQTPSRLKDGRILDYGLGLAIGEQAGTLEISHSGATSGYRTFLTRFPQHHVSIALLANRSDFNPGAVAQSLARLVLDLPSPKPAHHAVTANDLASHGGLYHCARTDEFVTLRARDGNLQVDNTTLRPTGPGTFVSPGGRATYAFAAGMPRRLTVTTTNATLDFDPVTPARPSPDDLAAYAGKYHSEELDVTHTVAVRDGKLTVSHWPGATTTATPTMRDGFRINRAWHGTFTRDARGAVDGYELTNGRCRRVRFDRR